MNAFLTHSVRQLVLFIFKRVFWHLFGSLLILSQSGWQAFWDCGTVGTGGTAIRASPEENASHSPQSVRRNRSCLRIIHYPRTTFDSASSQLGINREESIAEPGGGVGVAGRKPHKWLVVSCQSCLWGTRSCGWRKSALDKRKRWEFTTVSTLSMALLEELRILTLNK